MPIEVRYYTDPACIWSWGVEPKLRRLMWEFEGELSFTWVMGGLARSYGPAYRDEEGGIGSGPDCFADLIAHWLDVTAETEMPCDPRLWTQSPLGSTYPACMAVLAAAEQGPDAAYLYLRRLREGIVVERRKLDHAEALVAEAGTAGLDPERFRIDLGSHAVLEAFGAHLEEVRDPPEEARQAGAVVETEGRQRLRFPSALFVAADGSHHGVWGPAPLGDYRDAAIAAGAPQVNDGPLEPLAAVERFGRIAGREAEVLSGKPGPVVRAELWRLAESWQLHPTRALTGTMWERA